jgi:hypothetical protein
MSARYGRLSSVAVAFPMERPNKRLKLASAAKQGRIAYAPAAFDTRCLPVPPCAAPVGARSLSADPLGRILEATYYPAESLLPAREGVRWIKSHGTWRD